MRLVTHSWHFLSELEFLPFGPAEARVRRRKLTALPGAAVLHVRHGID